MVKFIEFDESLININKIQAIEFRYLLNHGGYEILIITKQKTYDEYFDEEKKYTERRTQIKEILSGENK